MPLPTASSSTLLLTSFTRVSQKRPAESCSKLGRLKFCCDGVVVCKRKSDAAVRVHTVAWGTIRLADNVAEESSLVLFLPVLTCCHVTALPCPCRFYPSSPYLVWHAYSVPTLIGRLYFAPLATLMSARSFPACHAPATPPTSNLHQPLSDSTSTFMCASFQLWQSSSNPSLRKYEPSCSPETASPQAWPRLGAWA